MSWKGCITLGILAVSLTAYALVFETETPAAWKPGRVFRDLEPAEIDRLEIRFLGPDGAQRVRAGETAVPAGEGGADSEGGAPEGEGLLRFVRQGEHAWSIEEPIRFPGLLPRIQGLTWNLADLVEVSEVSPEARDIFEPGQLEIFFRTKRGAEHRIEIGQDYPETSLDYLYLRLDGERVIVTRREIRETFALGLDDVRSRALVPVAPIDAVAFEIESPAPGVAKKLRRIPSESETEAVLLGGAWTFEGVPALEGTLADGRAVEALLNQLNSWKIESFESDYPLPPARLAELGFGPDALRLRVAHSDGRAAELEVGREFEYRDASNPELPAHARVYLRRPDEPFLFSARRDPLPTLRRDVETLRTETVFDLAGLDIVRLVAERPAADGQPGSTIRLERRERPKAAKQRADGRDFATSTWVVTDSEGEETTADRGLVGVALAEMRELMIQKFLAPFSAAERPSGAPPGFHTRVTLELEGGLKRVLYLGAHSTAPRDRDLEIYEAARSTDRARFLVESYWPRRLELGPLVFRERLISGFRASSLYEFEIRQLDEGRERSWKLYRLPEQDWSLPADVELLPDAALDQDLVKALVRTLDRDRFRVREFVPELERARYDDYGIGRQTFRYQLRLTHIDDGSTPKRGFRRITLGESEIESEPPAWYASFDEPEVAALVGREFVERLEGLARHLADITRPQP